MALCARSELGFVKGEYHKPYDHYLIIGLCECLNKIRTYILALPLLSSLCVEFDMVSQAECDLVVTKTSCIDISAMYANQLENSGNMKSVGRGFQKKGKTI